MKSGTFSTGGKTSNIENPRITWNRGMFQDTFFGKEEFLKTQLFIILDGDLYSSTRYVLSKLKPNLKQGDLIYFDDLHIPNQERLAVTEFISDFCNLKIICRTHDGKCGLFEVY